MEPTQLCNPGGSGEQCRSDAPGFWTDVLLPVALAALFFAAYLVNLGQQDFTNASENVVIQAALETRQGGPVWIPNMLGRPRLNKPPLATWITAGAMHRDTIGQIADGHGDTRDAAYHNLATQARWPSVLCSCLTLLAVYGLGRVMADRGVGLAAMAICGSSILFLRFGRMANTDVQITHWVAWANLCLAVVVLRGQWWRGCIGAGLCLGLAIMSKGPVALVQSVVPFMAFGLYRRFVPVEGLPASVPRAARAPRAQPSAPTKMAAVMAGIIACLAVALPWPVSVLLSQPGVMVAWFREITRVGATDHRPDPWWGYVNLLPNTLPWLPLVLGGLCFPLFARFRRRPIMLAWMLVVVPVVIMSFASDKAERYGMAMLPAASLLAGYLAVDLIRNRERLTISDRVVVVMQWAIVAGMAVALIAGVVPGTAGPGVAWYSRAAGIGGACVATAIVIGAMLLRQRIAWIGIAATVLVTLLAYHLFMIGYCTVGAGRSDFREIASRVAAEYPDADAVFVDSRPNPRHAPTDLAIYYGRVVRHATTIPAEPSPTRVQIVFLLQEASEAVRQIHDWTWLFAEPTDGKLCSVYRRLPSASEKEGPAIR